MRINPTNLKSRLMTDIVHKRVRRMQKDLEKVWKSEAANANVSNLPDYVAGISSTKTVTDSNIKIKLKLSGSAANASEGGVSEPYDIKKFLLTSSSARSGPKGPYVNVPMEHSATDIGRIGGSGALRRAQKLKPSFWATDARSRYASRPKVRGTGQFLKGGPLAGLIRTYDKTVKNWSMAQESIATTGAPSMPKGTKNTYMTFRRATGPPQKPWMVYPKKGKDVAGKVRTKIQARMREVFSGRAV